MNHSQSEADPLMPGNSASNLVEIYRRLNLRRDQDQSTSRYLQQLESLAVIFEDANCDLRLRELVEDWSYSRVSRKIKRNLARRFDFSRFPSRPARQKRA